MHLICEFKARQNNIFKSGNMGMVSVNVRLFNNFLKHYISLNDVFEVFEN